jgi:hypothetical protein
MTKAREFGELNLPGVAPLISQNRLTESRDGSSLGLLRHVQ